MKVQLVRPVDATTGCALEEHTVVYSVFCETEDGQSSVFVEPQSGRLVVKVKGPGVVVDTSEQG